MSAKASGYAVRAGRKSPHNCGLFYVGKMVHRIASLVLVFYGILIVSKVRPQASAGRPSSRTVLKTLSL